jgi:hypothetical protein
MVPGCMITFHGGRRADARSSLRCGYVRGFEGHGTIWVMGGGRVWPGATDAGLRRHGSRLESGSCSAGAERSTSCARTANRCEASKWKACSPTGHLSRSRDSPPRCEGPSGAGAVVATPLDEALSSGLVCAELEAMPAREAVDRLRDEHKVIASVTPYATEFLRFGPTVANNEDDVDHAVEAVAALT